MINASMVTRPDTCLLCHEPKPYDGRSEFVREGFMIPHPDVAARLYNEYLRKNHETILCSRNHR